jgi:membrane-bound lytic murein transglycosylase D
VAPATLRPADAAKRVGMSEAQFRAINNIPARMVIQAGSTLLVPRHDSVTHDVAEKAADTGQVSLAPEVVLKRSTVRAGKGESVASIARKYKVGTDTVAQWNKVSANATFKVGQQVVLFLPARSPVRSTAKPAPRGKAPVAKPRTTQPKKR